MREKNQQERWPYKILFILLWCISKIRGFHKRLQRRTTRKAVRLFKIVRFFIVAIPRFLSRTTSTALHDRRTTMCFTMWITLAFSCFLSHTNTINHLCASTNWFTHSHREVAKISNPLYTLGGTRTSEPSFPSYIYSTLVCSNSHHISHTLPAAMMNRVTAIRAKDRTGGQCSKYMLWWIAIERSRDSVRKS